MRTEKTVTFQAAGREIEVTGLSQSVGWALLAILSFMSPILLWAGTAQWSDPNTKPDLFVAGSYLVFFMNVALIIMLVYRIKNDIPEQLWEPIGLNVFFILIVALCGIGMFTNSFAMPLEHQPPLSQEFITAKWAWGIVSGLCSFGLTALAIFNVLYTEQPFSRPAPPAASTKEDTARLLPSTTTTAQPAPNQARMSALRVDNFL